MKTSIDYQIENLELQIRTVTRSINRPKSARQKAADVATLAGLQKKLEELKSKIPPPGVIELRLMPMGWGEYEKAVAENIEVWNKITNNAEPGTMEAQDSTDGEA